MGQLPLCQSACNSRKDDVNNEVTDQLPICETVAEIVTVDLLKTDGPCTDPRDNRYWLKAPIDVKKSTEEMHSERHFTGENADIRPLLDYTYHKKYKFDRVRLQDRLINDLSVGAAHQDDLLLPWVVFTAGAMGAGKGFIISFMEKRGYLPLDQFVIIDPDQIRHALPEWDAYVAEDPEIAAERTQKEAGHIAEILGYKALRSRWNVIFDGSLRDVEWYKQYFAKLRDAFPGIRLMILHVQAERESVLRRAEERGRQTGRVVPKSVLENSMDAVPRSVTALAPHADVVLKVLNLDQQEPKLASEEGAINPPPGIQVTWDYVKQLWKPIDSDGDGELSKAEVIAAVAQGLLTEAVLDTIDINRDGAISKEEFMKAKLKCFNSGSIRYREPSFSQLSLIKTRTERWSSLSDQDRAFNKSMRGQILFDHSIQHACQISAVTSMLKRSMFM